ncbi:hypothetical protein LTR97_012712 [Elasticomyces elasticus]|uniref:Peptidase M12A domain-containing protein n=1 Tax=Elasticomyces elasticus TaxID=574655 RepID=A0AAN7VQI2_9PEZI|nr:hypothetical protein LTR97_012712 [Elasticomyces elasticus]
MMLGPILLALMSFLFTVCSACPQGEFSMLYSTNITTNSTTNSTNHLDPRWYSVPDLRGMYIGPWPVTKYDAVNGNQAHIPYCYVDAWAVSNLAPLFGEVFSKFKEAIDQSALDFVPDPDCKGVLECECSPNSNPNTLRISGAPANGAKEGTRSDASCGFMYFSTEPGRHTVKIANYKWDDTAGHAEKVLEATHEIAHVVGLDHEHQRPDRDVDLRFHCFALRGAVQAYDKLEFAKDNPDKAEIPYPAECKDLHPIFCLDKHLCHNPTLAVQWKFSDMLPFTLGNLWPQNRDFQRGPDINTSPIDTDSITIYPSFAGAVKEGDSPIFPDDAVLLGVSRDDDKEFPIYTGGNADPALAGLSASDISRIVQLYPKNIVKISGSDGW